MIVKTRSSQIVLIDHLKFKWIVNRLCSWCCIAGVIKEQGVAEFDPLSRGITGRQACHLSVPGTDSAAQLSVVSFKATEKIGEPNVVTVELTHPQQLSRAYYLNLDAVFSIESEDGVTKKFSGYIERFSTIQTTKDYTKYQVVLKSHFGRLQAVTNTQPYQHVTTPQIIEAVVRRHGIPDHLISFRLRRQYPVHLWRFQYQMTDFDYVHMLMEKAGIYSYVVETEHGDQIVFADDIDHYLYDDPQRIVPYREAAGLEAGGVEAVTSIMTHTSTVPQSFIVADYNPDAAWERFRDEANIAPQDGSTYGQPYVYGTNHLDQAGAKWEAQLRHEAALARQVIYEGESTVLSLQCASVLEMDSLLPDAPKGQVIVEVTHSGARDKSYTNSYKAIPADRRFRLQLEPTKWAKIAGSLSARVCSPDKYAYGYLNAAGYYVVRLDADFGNWPKGGESVPLRLAKPFAGKLQTGMHFVALDNDEAKITFRDGDPDKPEISGFHHHLQARDLVTSDRRWLSRNMIRTQKNNKLRFEDWNGQEGAKLSTEHSGKSQLNLGYLVDSKLEYRGEGTELRTSGWGALRAGKGVMVTTYDRPGATGKQLDMQETIAQLEEALATAKALAASATSAKAEPADTDAQQQMKDDLDGLKKPGLLMSTPASAALVAGQGVQFASQGDISAVAGKNADWSVLKRFTVAAGEVISLFAQKLGIKIFAAKGPVEVQAQGGPMSLVADKDVTVSSVNGTVRIVAKNELTLESGGAFIQFKDGSITLGGPADLFIKTITVQKQGKATLNMSLDLNHPALSGMPTTPLTINAAASPASRAAIPSGMPYKLFAAGAMVKQGVFDDTGLLQVDHHPTTQQYTLELASGVKHTIPVATSYRGDAANGDLANQGFHFHESQTSTDINPPGDRALNRQRYNELLNPEAEQ
jgi:type VI secretion system secreted protein VgrG